jgi:hypothetical protein
VFGLPENFLGKRHDMQKLKSYQELVSLWKTNRQLAEAWARDAADDFFYRGPDNFNKHMEWLDKEAEEEGEKVVTDKINAYLGAATKTQVTFDVIYLDKVLSSKLGPAPYGYILEDVTNNGSMHHYVEYWTVSISPQKRFDALTERELKERQEKYFRTQSRYWEAVRGPYKIARELLGLARG